MIELYFKRAFDGIIVIDFDIVALVNSNDRKINASLNAEAITSCEWTSTSIPELWPKSSASRKTSHFRKFWLHSIRLLTFERCLNQYFNIWSIRSKISHPDHRVWSILSNDNEMKMLLISVIRFRVDFLLNTFILFEFSIDFCRFHNFFLTFPAFWCEHKECPLDGSKFCKFCFPSHKKIRVSGLFRGYAKVQHDQKWISDQIFNWSQFLLGFSLLWAALGWRFDYFSFVG